MIFLNLLLQHLIANEVQFGVNTCICDSSSGFCDANCTMEIGKKTYLPDCKDKPFHSHSPLGEWLINEFFCIYKRHGDPPKRKGPNNEEFPPDFDFLKRYDPLSYRDTNPTDSRTDSDRLKYKYGDLLKAQDNSTFFIPAPYLATAECRTDIQPLEFLVPVDTIQCYYNNTEGLNFSFPDNFLGNDGSLIPISISENCTNNKYKEIKYNIFYNNETMNPTRVDVITKCYNDSEIDTKGFLSLQEEIHYYSNSTEVSLAKSGNFGYSYGQPLIVSIDKSNPEQFPIPFGNDCQNVKYTSLMFGYDTIGGCSKNAEDMINVFSRYTRISKLGKANGNAKEDWIHIDTSETENCTHLAFNIYYEFIGNVHNPQNQIYSANYQCLSNESEDYFLLVVSFLRSGDIKTKRHIPKPKGLPDDTFAPIYQP
ncbi:hypothetical protein M9Y10_009627 [Tritrichomonas musculus]|uniref:Tectonic domain-containing protein n=1 Tax=Tritrichomonas musculus TaxID=1915356 RepID=A0ABR2IP14_9EUKA